MVYYLLFWKKWKVDFFYFLLQIFLLTYCSGSRYFPIIRLCEGNFINFRNCPGDLQIQSSARMKHLKSFDWYILVWKNVFYFKVRVVIVNCRFSFSVNMCYFLLSTLFFAMVARFDMFQRLLILLICVLSFHAF